MPFYRPNTNHPIAWKSIEIGIPDSHQNGIHTAVLTIAQAAHAESFPFTHEWEKMTVLAHDNLLMRAGKNLDYDALDAPVLKLESPKGPCILRLKIIGENSRVTGMGLEKVHAMEKRFKAAGLGTEQVLGIFKGAISVDGKKPVPFRLYATDHLGQSVGERLNQMADEKEIERELDDMLEYIRAMHDAGLSHGHPHPYNFYRVRGKLRTADLAEAIPFSASGTPESLRLADLVIFFTGHFFNPKVQQILDRKKEEFRRTLPARDRLF